MPRFEPFRGVRYDADLHDAAAVTAPPYDVIDADQRAEIAAGDPHNVVHIDVPVGDDPYRHANEVMRSWLADGTLVLDDEPGFYVMRMGFTDRAGHAHQTSGVIGALGIAEPGSGEVLPHEQTTPKAKTDRLDLMRATAANLSPIWGLSLASGLSSLAEMATQPIARCTDADGVHHRLYRVVEAGLVGAIRDTVESQPVVVADGHHRYEVSRIYRDERRASDGQGPWDLTMAFVIELAPDQLHVRAIHRAVHDVPAGTDLLEVLGAWCTPYETGAIDDTIEARLDDAGAMCLVRRGHPPVLLVPKPGVFDDLDVLDTLRLERALADVPHRLAYLHDPAALERQVERGEADAAVLLRPVSVAVIEQFARERRLMPPKSTFFAPKPRTGLVIRPMW